MNVFDYILTVGCTYERPKGGIAQLLYNYSYCIYNPFKFIANSGSGNFVTKLIRTGKGVILFLFRLLLDSSIRIVHIHTASNNSFRRSAFYLRLSKCFHKKVVLHIHGGGFAEYYNVNQGYVAQILNKSDCIICLSEKWLDFFQKVSNCPIIRIVDNVVPEPVVEPVRISCKCHALFLGLLCPQKGIYDLLQVIIEHKDEFRDKFVLHIGGNGEVEKVKQIIFQEKLQDIVRLEGWVNGDKKVELLSQCHFYILPSYAEGLPMSILEAMSYQMPILSTPVGGIPEIVEDGVNGFLSVPGNHEALYKNIRTLIDNPSLVQEMGRQSYLRVKNHFAENVQKELEKIYQELLK